MCSEVKLMPIPIGYKALDYEDEEFIDNNEFGLDENGQKCFKIDACIVPIIQWLWDHNIFTIGSCCGHNAGPAVISFDMDFKEYDGTIPHHCTKCGLLHAEIFI